MARAKKVKLAPARARLKWVFDKYGASDPLVPYVVHHVFRYAIIRTPFFGAPRYGELPKLDATIRYLQESFLPAAVGHGLVATAVEEGLLPAEGYNPPLGPLSIDATLGEAMEWTNHWLLADVMINAGFAARRECTKLIPHLARWVNEFAQTPEHLSGIYAPGTLPVSLLSTVPAHELDARWNERAFYSTAEAMALARMDCIDTGRTRLCPSDALRQTPSGHWRGWAHFAEQFRPICDWYDAERPDLGQYPTFASAREAAEEWHSHIPLDAQGQPIEQGEVVYRWPDGWTVQTLASRLMFRQEGESLGHCIGESQGYWQEHQYGHSRFFSLRDPDGRPWFTFQVSAPMISTPAYHGIDEEGGVAHVVQIKGCKNRTPGVKAMSRDCPSPLADETTRVWDFLSATPWPVGHDYQSAWRLTVHRLGFGLEDQPVAEWTAGDLVRPPTFGTVPEGKLVQTALAEGTWWERRSTRRRA